MFKEIVSPQNPLLKQCAELKQKKYRTLRRSFLAEGVRCVEEAWQSGWQVRSLFFTQELLGHERGERLVRAAEGAGVECCLVKAALLQRLSDTETSQGIIAEVAMQEMELAVLAAAEGVVLVLDEVSDPGNVGTIIRTADAANAAGVILLENSVDLYSPKVVRAAMGSLFHIPTVTGMSKERVLAWCRSSQRQLWVSALQGGANVNKQSWPEKTALVIGNEARGVSEELLAVADKRVFIPMPGRAESLNAAVAAGILLFAALRSE